MEENLKITAQLVIINDDGYVLCVSRKDNHSSMGLPGGKMEEQDMGNPHLTAIRETLEETGISVNLLDIPKDNLIFATHKYGSMSYTYLARNYYGEIDYDEPHAVKWGTFQDLIDGSFGEYNKQVYDSLIDRGISVKL
jgi:8-oxo-dGTP pyrophosphatase MutT (NUDIX family)